MCQSINLTNKIGGIMQTIDDVEVNEPRVETVSEESQEIIEKPETNKQGTEISIEEKELTMEEISEEISSNKDIEDQKIEIHEETQSNKDIEDQKQEIIEKPEEFTHETKVVIEETDKEEIKKETETETEEKEMAMDDNQTKQDNETQNIEKPEEITQETQVKIEETNKETETKIEEKELKMEDNQIKQENETQNKVTNKKETKIQNDVILEIMEVPKQEEPPKKNLTFLKKYKNEKKEEIVDVNKRKQILDEIGRVEKEEIDEDQEFHQEEEEEGEGDQLQFKPSKPLNLEDFKHIKSKEGYLIKATLNSESGHIRYIVASKGANKVLVTVWNNDKSPKSKESPIQKLYINQNVIQEKYPFKTLKKTPTIEKGVSFIHSLEFIPIHGGPKDRVRLWASNEREAKEWEISIRAMLLSSMEETNSIEKPVESSKFVEKKTSEIQPTTSTSSNSGRVGKLKGFFSKLITNSEKEDTTTKKKSFSFLKK
jgi:hypothetical protein